MPHLRIPTDLAQELLRPVQRLARVLAVAGAGTVHREELAGRMAALLAELRYLTRRLDDDLAMATTPAGELPPAGEQRMVNVALSDRHRAMLDALPGSMAANLRAGLEARYGRFVLGDEWTGTGEWAGWSITLRHPAAGAGTPVLAGPGDDDVFTPMDLELTD